VFRKTSNFQLSLCLNLIVITGLVSSHFHTGVEGHASVKPLKADVTGTEEQLYCKNQSDLFTVYIRTKLTVANTSSKRIIMARTLSPAARVRVSMTPQDAHEGRFVYNPNPYEVKNRNPKSANLGATPDANIFITLDPGEKYETAIWAGVLADLSTKQVSEHPAMTSGSFRMQVFVRTWPYEVLDPAEFERAKSKWSDVGELLNEVIPSNDYPISLPNSPLAPSCEKFKAPGP
jgi:hypothetical protein